MNVDVLVIEIAAGDILGIGTDGSTGFASKIRDRPGWWTETWLIRHSGVAYRRSSARACSATARQDPRSMYNSTFA